MRIAFYAPLKPPDHPVPSGDRRMGRLLIAALRLAGHEVEVASRLRSRDGAGNAGRQLRLAGLGARLAARYLHRSGPMPDLWFTYHLYDKAPDHLGPAVAAALGIPYVVAEASLAPSRASGAWAAGHESVAAALRQAALVIGFNDADADCVIPALAEPGRYHHLRPFLDTGPYAALAALRALLRGACAAAYGLDPARPWLVALAMMRPGAKRASYRLLAQALQPLAGRDWQLLAIGDGAARAEIAAALAPLGNQAILAGAVLPKAVPALLTAADMMVWPAIDEAYGMALLEAQAAGLPVVAGSSPGVEGIVGDGTTGLLAPQGDTAALTAQIARLLDDADLRRTLGAAARRRVIEHHDLPHAAALLDTLLRAAACAR
jgi:glycosyltransferase involved in cell wall biosynthesis